MGSTLFFLIAIGVPYAFAALTLLLISLPLPLISEEFGLPGVLAGFLAGSVFIGMFIGATSFGWLADRVGRKKALQIALLILGLSTLLCSFSTDWLQLILLRVLTGIGIGSTIPLCFVYLSEFTEPSTRGRVLVLLDSFWAYGWILATLLGFLVIPGFGWRTYFVSSAIPVLASLAILHYFLPETPLYLAKAKKISPLSALKQLWSKDLRKITAGIWVMWFFIVYGYYSFFLWIIGYMRKIGYPLPEAYFYNLLTSLAQIPGYFLAALLVDRVGRKPTLIGFSAATAISILGFSLSKTPLELVLWLSLIDFFCLGAWGVVMTYTAEPFPTYIRGAGYGFASGFGRIAGIVGPTLTGYMLSRLSVERALQVISIAFIVIALDIAVLGVETRGRELK